MRRKVAKSNAQYTDRHHIRTSASPTNMRLTKRGKTRLAKWYVPYSDEEKIKLKGEVRTSQFSPLSHLASPSAPSPFSKTPSDSPLLSRSTA